MADTVEPPPLASDAPFGITAVPTGWDRVMTQAEADEWNLVYPVPPYGNTYVDPGNPYVPPPAPPVLAKFVKIDQIVPGLTTQGVVSDPGLMHENLIFVLWPISGVFGIVDDIGSRPVRVINVMDDVITFNFDSTGLDTADLVLLGVVYVGP